MSKDWEKEYSEKSLKDTPLPARLLKNHINLLTGGQALDIASGTGQNAVFLSSHGYEVIAVDKSPSAAASLPINILLKKELRSIRLQRIF